MRAVVVDPEAHSHDADDGGGAADELVRGRGRARVLVRVRVVRVRVSAKPKPRPKPEPKPKPTPEPHLPQPEAEVRHGEDDGALDGELVVEEAAGGHGDVAAHHPEGDPEEEHLGEDAVRVRIRLGL